MSQDSHGDATLLPEDAQIGKARTAIPFHEHNELSITWPQRLRFLPSLPAQERDPQCVLA